MLIAVLSGFILALCLSFFGRLLKGKLSFILSALPILLFLYSLSFVPRRAEGERVAFIYTWISSHGIHWDVHLDGLSLLFWLLNTGSGSLVFLYTSAFLKGHVY